MAANQKIDPVLEPYLSGGRTLVLDGGLATELERRGLDLKDPLWSAKVLLEDPDAIRQVHLDYLEAGADCIITSTYQATFEGLMARGLSRTDTSALLHQSVQLAVEARDEFNQRTPVAPFGSSPRLNALVAAGVGPYGAYLADGSEYRGNYGLDADRLADFHRERWHLLAGSGADFLLCETIPAPQEAQAFTALAQETPGVRFALSFSCVDDLSISDRTRVRDLPNDLFEHPALIAVGVNCTSPQFVASLVREFRARTNLPIIAYPNSGENWDAARHRWTGTTHPIDFATAALEWRRAGATLIGGCCRTGPQHVRSARQRLVSS